MMNHQNANQELVAKLESLLAPVAEREGCIVYDIEFGGLGAGRTLRIFIDKADPQAPEGVSIDDCTKVSRGANEVLDLDENIIPGGAYNLEVSTPGIDRNLKKAWHFQRVLGKKIWIKTDCALGTLGLQNKGLISAKQVTDVVESADDSAVVLAVAGESLRIPYEKMEKAKLVFEMPKAGKPKHNGKKK